MDEGLSRLTEQWPLNSVRFQSPEEFVAKCTSFWLQNEIANSLSLSCSSKLIERKNGKPICMALTFPNDEIALTALALPETHDLIVSAAAPSVQVDSACLQLVHLLHNLKKEVNPGHAVQGILNIVGQRVLHCFCSSIIIMCSCSSLS